MSLKNFFKLSENNTDIKTEFIAGLTTFLAMSYILGVNPGMLSATGMTPSSIFFATAIASGIGCILMGLLSKYPVGVAPGMGLNAIFTFTIVLGLGVSWQAGLAAVFITSILFLLITISGLREAILNAIPHNLKLAVGAGIGFFLAFIGLQGCGIIVADPSTIVGLGSLTAAPALLAIIGILITLILYIRKVPAAVFIGLVVTAIIGIIMTLIGIPVAPESAALMPQVPTQVISTSFDLSLFGGFLSGFTELFSVPPTQLILVVFSLLFVMFFDTTGTLIPLAQECGFVDDEGNADGIAGAFLGDAISGILGSIIGTSTLTAYVESATGIALGGRTGLTAIFVGIFFLLSALFAPLVLALFTSSVTCAALVIVGILMMAQLKDLSWDELAVVAPAFMTIIMMLLTYSISLGIAWGFITYAVVEISRGNWKKLSWLVWVLVIVFLIYLFFGL